MAAFQARQTLARSLESLADQTVTEFEFVLVESGADPAGQAALERVPLQSDYIYAPGRLLPHDALNLGVARASGGVLVFIDADAYARPDWLQQHLEAHRRGHTAVAGGVACFGRTYLDLGAHLAKFDKWLPGLPAHSLEEAPTVNFSVDRSVWEAFGPFAKSQIHADTELCWRIRQGGGEIWFSPQAIVEHHHTHSWARLLSERFGRGGELERLRLSLRPTSPLRRLLRGLASLLPLRLISQMGRVGRNAGQARMGWESLLTAPVTTSLLEAWLLGEFLADFGLRARDSRQEWGG
jgi:GT2 family glycosyltransferase